MSVYVLSIGINDYAGTQNDLHKCVADAQVFSSLFRAKPYLLDKQATRVNVIQAVQKFSQLPGPGEWYVGHYSGHGSQIPDRNHDEKDRKDEVIVTADLNYIVDDEFPALISHRNSQAKILQVFDSCFSGDMTRSFSLPRNKDEVDVNLRPHSRFLDPSHLKMSPRALVQNHYTSPFLPNVIVFSACADYEYSYEGETNGVFTGALVQTYKPSLTIGQWFIAASRLIRNSEFGSRQHPQINCHPSCLSWPVPAI